MKPIIHVTGLGKEYTIGSQASAYSTIREALTQATKSLFSAQQSRSQEKIWALRNLDFDVQTGEVVGVIGRNGAGKSTLLKILSRITEPTTGRIEMRGRVGSLLEVGTGFHPELTGRENIFLNGSILGMSRREIQQRFDEIVEFAEIKKFIDTPVKRYSSGMYLRLAFAVAAHLETEILLVDEVLAVGDASFQRKCLSKMEDVAHRGRTVLFVSHNMSAVQRLCSRVIYLSQGIVVEQGDPKTAIKLYLAEGLAQPGERVWQSPAEAPGDEVARLKAVRGRNLQGEVSAEFSVRESWYVEIEFWVLSPAFINVNVYFYDESGSLVFMSGDFQDSRWQEQPRPVGVHRSRCLIPKDLLNDGTLRVLVGLATPPTTLRALERDAAYFEITDDVSQEGARGFYPGSWPGGAVRPALKWEFDYEADERLKTVQIAEAAIAKGN